MTTCPTCQQPVHAKARLCLSCGAAIPQRGRRLWWNLAQLGSVFGGLILIFGVTLANGAPQEASAAAIAIACAVIPYCMARAVDERRDR